MSILAHLIYDEAQARSYRAEAEAIVANAVGNGTCLLSRSGYQNAVTAVVRSLTLYDLYHEPGTAPALRNHPVRMTIPEERYDLACQAVRDFLRQSPSH